MCHSLVVSGHPRITSTLIGARVVPVSIPPMSELSARGRIVSKMLVNAALSLYYTHIHTVDLTVSSSVSAHCYVYSFFNSVGVIYS